MSDTIPATLVIALVCALSLGGCSELTPGQRAAVERIEPNSVSFGFTDLSLFAAPHGQSHFGNIGGSVVFTYVFKPTPTRPMGPYSVPVAYPVSTPAPTPTRDAAPP